MFLVVLFEGCGTMVKRPQIVLLDLVAPDLLHALFSLTPLLVFRFEPLQDERNRNGRVRLERLDEIPRLVAVYPLYSFLVDRLRRAAQRVI